MKLDIASNSGNEDMDALRSASDSVSEEINFHEGRSTEASSAETVKILAEPTDEEVEPFVGLVDEMIRQDEVQNGKPQTPDEVSLQGDRIKNKFKTAMRVLMLI